jgi:AcrR family transcriptional regulator
VSNTDNPTRRRILEAARRLFASGGYDAVSITALAEAARVNRAVLYYYFKNKRDLYRESIKSVLELIPALWERREVREGPPGERFENYVNALWRALAENRESLPLIMREVSGGGPERELIFEHYLVPNVLQLAEILEEGAAQGDFGDVPPLLAAVAVLSGMIMPNFGLAVGRTFFGRAAPDMWDGQAYPDFYREYVRRALGGESTKGGGKRGADK